MDGSPFDIAGMLNRIRSGWRVHSANSLILLGMNLEYIARFLKSLTLRK